MKINSFGAKRNLEANGTDKTENWKEEEEEETEGKKEK